MTRSIRVDDEVFAKLQSLAEPFVDTPNTTLRRLLGLTGGPQGAVGGQRTPGGAALLNTLGPLLADGRLTAGQQLVWRRRNLGEVHIAVVLPDGDLQLADGSVHSTPSGAASALAGNPQNGWRAFATADGTRLSELR